MPPRKAPPPAKKNTPASKRPEPRSESRSEPRSAPRSAPHRSTPAKSRRTNSKPDRPSRSAARPNPSRASGSRTGPARAKRTDKIAPIVASGGQTLARLSAFFSILIQRTRKSIQRERTLTQRPAPHPKKSAGEKPTQEKPSQKSQIEFPPAEPSTLDRRLDIVGVALVFIGLPLILLLASANHDASTLSLLNLLWKAFGWGVYLLPLTMIVVGGWLVLRNFEHIPWPSPERIAGVVLLFFNILIWLDWLLSGGGWVGSGIRYGLILSLGTGGAFILLFAWLLIAVIFALDKTAADLFTWLPPIILRLQDAWDDFRSRNGGMSPPLPSSVVPAAADGLPAGLPASPAGPAPAGEAAPIASGQPRQWQLPKVDDILEPGIDVTHDDEYDRQRAAVIEQTLASFGAPVNVVEINRGPAITQFGVEPDFIETRNGRMRVRVSKISALVDDLALALAAKTIRVQAPVPGKGYVGIEVPNEKIAQVALREVIESDAFGKLKSPLRFALGEDVAGNAVAAVLDAMPHLLIAGATGSGKSVCVNSLICCLLLHNTPDDVRLVMVDPKRVELTGYNGIPHLLAPVVVEMERVVGVLQWVLREMDSRYQKLAGAGARNILEYNQKVASGTDAKFKKLPRLVVIIDELADLMMLAPEETERSLARLAQLARATGIHIVIATQRPSVDVVTGLIKANFPARVAFAVASGTDSRVILDQPGAERLLGRGDMLFQAPDSPAPLRIQGTYLSDAEIQTLVYFWRQQTGLAETSPTAAGGIVDALPSGVPLKQMPLWEEAQEEESDALYQEAVDVVRRQGRASITMLQRRLRIGYTRSARLIEAMQEKKIIGSEPGPQGFEILDYGAAAPPVEEQ